MLTSEYGENGHGSTPPCELMWKNPLPAATQPPELFSSPGNEIYTISGCSSRSLLISEARYFLSSSPGASAELSSVTGTNSTKMTTLHPRSDNSFRKRSVVTSFMFFVVTVTDAPKISPLSWSLFILEMRLSYIPSPRLASVISLSPSILMTGSRFLLLSSSSRYFSSINVPFVKIGNSISGVSAAAVMTSRLSIGSPPAKRIKLIPTSFASVKIFAHSSSVSCPTGSESNVA